MFNLLKKRLKISYLTRNLSEIKLIGQPTIQSHPHLFQQQDELVPGIKKSEFQERRAKLAELIKSASFANKNHLVIVSASTKKYMSDKIPYVFRQNSDFYYLTGVLEPDCCMVLIQEESKMCKTVLFTRDKDEHAELWDGPRTHPEDAAEHFGMDQSLPMSELQPFLKKTCTKKFNFWYDFEGPFQDLIKDFLVEEKIRKVEPPKAFLHELRLVKSVAEQALMRRSCKIAGDAFVKVLQASKPGINEHEMFARFDYECRVAGAEYLAYPPVVAGGNRATTIHYINNNQLLDNGDLILMDAGCEYHAYSSDITRTWPINGSFTKEQRLLYDVVLAVQQQLIKLSSAHPSLDQLYNEMCSLLGVALQQVGLLKHLNTPQQILKAVQTLCPHHVSHYLGMDVHDTSLITRQRHLAPGMIITIEPGLYVGPNCDFLPKEFKGIGIRIEDDVLITQSESEVLSRTTPKHPQDLEGLVGSGKTKSQNQPGRPLKKVLMKTQD